MKKLKTRNEYVGCNGKARFYADEIEATSYGWWYFVRVIQGKVVFNNYNYSSTTNNHQWTVRSLMNKLGIEIDLYVNMHESLTEEHFKYFALHSLYTKALELIAYNQRPRIRKSTIESNKEAIRGIKEEIKVLKSMGCVFNFKKFYHYARLEKRHNDNKKKFHEVTKGLKGQYLREKETSEIFKVEKIDHKDFSLVIRNVETSRPRYVANYHHKTQKFSKDRLLQSIYN